MVNPTSIGSSNPPLNSEQARKQIQKLADFGTDGAHKYIAIKGNTVTFTDRRDDKSNVTEIVDFIKKLQIGISPREGTETNLEELQNKFTTLNEFIDKFKNNYVQRYNTIWIKFLRLISSNFERQFTSQQQSIEDTSSLLRNKLQSNQEQIFKKNLRNFVKEQTDLGHVIQTDTDPNISKKELYRRLSGTGAGTWLIEKNKNGKIYFHYKEERHIEPKFLQIQTPEHFDIMLKHTSRNSPLVDYLISNLFGEKAIDKLRKTSGGAQIYQSMVKIPIDSWGSIESFISTAQRRFKGITSERIDFGRFKELLQAHAGFRGDDNLLRAFYNLYLGKIWKKGLEGMSQGSKSGESFEDVAGR